jgi:hypothetical protein
VLSRMIDQGRNMLPSAQERPRGAPLVLYYSAQPAGEKKILAVDAGAVPRPHHKGRTTGCLGLATFFVTR